MEGCREVVFITSSNKGQHMKHGPLQKICLSVNQSEEEKLVDARTKLWKARLQYAAQRRGFGVYSIRK